MNIFSKLVCIGVIVGQPQLHPKKAREQVEWWNFASWICVMSWRPRFQGGLLPVAAARKVGNCIWVASPFNIQYQVFDFAECLEHSGQDIALADLMASRMELTKINSDLGGQRHPNGTWLWSKTMLFLAPLRPDWMKHVQILCDLFQGNTTCAACASSQPELQSARRSSYSSSSNRTPNWTISSKTLSVASYGYNIYIYNIHMPSNTHPLCVSYWKLEFVWIIFSYLFEQYFETFFQSSDIVLQVLGYLIP